MGDSLCSAGAGVVVCQSEVKGKVMNTRDELVKTGVLKPNGKIVREHRHDNQQAVAARKLELQSPATKRALMILEVARKRGKSV